MLLSSLIIENRWILELFYALIISSICMAIVLTADRFYKLSLHQGIRYFRNAFFFYGVAFIVRYTFGIFSDFSINYSYVLRGLFEYFIVMAGFFLFYSLVWKKFEPLKEKDTSSLFNLKMIIFHLMAVIITVLDILWNTYYSMFSSQIIIFFYALIISYLNYRRNGRQHKFLKFYFIAMLLSFTAWLLNFLAASYFEWNREILLGIGVINVIFFLLFLYGVKKVTQKK